MDILVIVPLNVLLFIIAFVAFVVLDIAVAICIILLIVPISIGIIYKYCLYEKTIHEWKNTKTLDDLYSIYECLGITSLTYYTFLHNYYFKLGKKEPHNPFWPPSFANINMFCYPSDTVLWMQLDKMLYNINILKK